jgi:molybdate/tungstate transport system substrate-binding protein
VQRRHLLATLGTLGSVGAAGCLGGDAVRVLAAGSLARAFETGVAPAFRTATGTEVRGEFHGSATVLRLVTDGVKHPDVVVSADVDLLRRRLRPAHASWDVTFATNALGIAVAPDSPVRERLAAGEPWYDVLPAAERPVARSDPDVDPLGYRTLQAFALAADHYGVPDLPDRLRDATVVDPSEAHLLTGVETGDRAAAFCYRNMAVGRDLPWVSLPAELDFSDPALAERYARATYTLPDGTVVRGSPVVYAATVLDDADRPAAGRRFVRFLVDRADLLVDHGLTVPADLPQTDGRAPPEVSP